MKRREREGREVRRGREKGGDERKGEGKGGEGVRYSEFLATPMRPLDPKVLSCVIGAATAAKQPYIEATTACRVIHVFDVYNST